MIYIHSARNTSHHSQARPVPAPPQQSQLSHSLLSPQLLPLVSTGEALGIIVIFGHMPWVSVGKCVCTNDWYQALSTHTPNNC